MFEDHWRGAGAGRGGARGLSLLLPLPPGGRAGALVHPPCADARRDALPPVLDMEWTPTSPTCTIRRDPEDPGRGADLLDILERPLRPAPDDLYTLVDFFEDTELWRLRGGVLAAVGRGPPHGVYDGKDWSFWQYTSTGLVPGIAGKVDINVFAGSAAAWGAWRTARAQ
jgi:lysozyme